MMISAGRKERTAFSNRLSQFEPQDFNVEPDRALEV